MSHLIQYLQNIVILCVTDVRVINILLWGGSIVFSPLDISRLQLVSI